MTATEPRGRTSRIVLLGFGAINRRVAEQVLDVIERRMRQVADATCQAFEARCEFEFEFERYYPPTINAPQETEFAQTVLNGVVGAENVLEFEPTMGAEDFSSYLLEKPGCYFLVGNGDGTHRSSGHGAGPCMLHNPSYDFNDELIPLGGAMWVRVCGVDNPCWDTIPRKSASRP